MIIPKKQKFQKPVLRGTPVKRQSSASKLTLPCPANDDHICHWPRCPAKAQPSGFHRCRYKFVMVEN